MSRPSFNCSKKALNDYIFYLETESEEYLIDHYNESPLIINGDGQMWWKGYWLTYTDKEKKSHLDRDIDKYFGRETPIDVNVVVEPMSPGWEQRIFEGCYQIPQDDY